MSDNMTGIWLNRDRSRIMILDEANKFATTVESYAKETPLVETKSLAVEKDSISIGGNSIPMIADKNRQAWFPILHVPSHSAYTCIDASGVEVPETSWLSKIEPGLWKKDLSSNYRFVPDCAGSSGTNETGTVFALSADGKTVGEGRYTFEDYEVPSGLKFRIKFDGYERAQKLTLSVFGDGKGQAALVPDKYLFERAQQKP